MLSAVTLALVAAVAAARITEHPSPVSVPEGAPATLHCRTSPPAPVVWEREGRPVPSSEGVLALPDGSLFLLSTTARDAGRYRCRAGAARSRAALLEVRFLRAAFGPVDRALRAAEGGLALLPCLAPRGRPEPALRWERDGLPVEGRRVEGGALVLEGVGPADAGAYTCVAANSEGEERDHPVELEVVPTGSTTHEVVLVERQEEELSLRVWAVAVALAVVVTLALLALALLVCLRYRRLALPPPEMPGDGGASEQGSTGSYDSARRLLSHHTYGGLPGGAIYKGPVYRPPERHYASSPVVRPDYSRPFNYVVIGAGAGEGEYHAPAIYS